MIAMGAVADRLSLTTAEVKSYLKVEHDDDDTLISTIIAAAKRHADDYLKNPFQEDKPKITVTSVALNDTIQIEGQTYTAKDAESISEREFDRSGTDTETAESLVDCINSALRSSSIYFGVRGVTASNTANVITLTRDYLKTDQIVVSSSDDDTLLVQYELTNLDIPDSVKLGVLKLIASAYEHRVSEKKSESVDQLGSWDWGKEGYKYLAEYKFYYVG